MFTQLSESRMRIYFSSLPLPPRLVARIVYNPEKDIPIGPISEYPLTEDALISGNSLSNASTE